MFECDTCGCRASKRALLNYYTNLPAVTEPQVREELRKDVPYAECFNDECDGLFARVKDGDVSSFDAAADPAADGPDDPLDSAESLEPDDRLKPLDRES